VEEVFMVVKSFFVCASLLFSFGVFSMERVVIPQRTFDCIYGKLVISPFPEPSSFYADDRETLDAVRYPAHNNHVRSCIGIFEDMKRGEGEYSVKSGNLTGYNCLTHQQNIDITNAFFHSVLIDTEDGIIESSMTVGSFPYWKNTRDYLSQATIFNGEHVACDLWEKVAINLTALRNKIFHEEIWRSEYTDYREAIQSVICITADWPTGHYLSWSIAKAISE
jgi:hypothetical protein